MITVTCSCGKTFHVKDSFAGKKAKCSCGKVLTIPDKPQDQKLSPEKISFSCDCGKSFAVPEKYEGKKVRCKVCQKELTVPLKSKKSKDKKPDEIIDDDRTTSTEKIAPAEPEEMPKTEIESSEKPKRLLFVCISMLLIGFFAYGTYMFFSSKKSDTIPDKQEMVTPSQPESEEKMDSTQQPSDSSSETLTPVESETTVESKTESEKEPEKKTEKPEAKPVVQEPAEKKVETITQPPKQPKKIPQKTLPDEEPKKEEVTETEVKEPEPPQKDESLLRDHPMTFTRKQVIDMIQKFNFYDSQYNPNGGFPNRYVDNRNGTITDNESKLMWQKSGSREMMSWNKAPEYIDRLNNRKYAGYADWRLPTLEELLTLTEPRHSRQGHFLSSFFSQKQGIVGSSDSCTYDGKKIPWYTSFLRGISNCVSYDLIDEFYVRAVRSVKNM